MTKSMKDLVADAKTRVAPSEGFFVEPR